jgi:hypothetical protein
MGRIGVQKVISSGPLARQWSPKPRAGEFAGRCGGSQGPPRETKKQLTAAAATFFSGGAAVTLFQIRARQPQVVISCGEPFRREITWI